MDGTLGRDMLCPLLGALLGLRATWGSTFLTPSTGEAALCSSRGWFWGLLGLPPRGPGCFLSPVRGLGCSGSFRASRDTPGFSSWRFPGSPLFPCSQPAEVLLGPGGGRVTTCSARIQRSARGPGFPGGAQVECNRGTAPCLVGPWGATPARHTWRSACSRCRLR